MKNITIVLLSLLFFYNTSCQRKQHAKNIKGYDLSKPTIFNMPYELDEISGITFVNGKPDTIYAEQDEDGKLFYFHLGDEQVNYTKFGKHGDYEDLAICNGYVVMLRSDGVLFSFPFNEIRNKKVSNVKET